MYNAIKKHRNSESGFTLVELLIVIVIMGILAAVVVFSVGGVTDNGTKSACNADVSAVNIAAEAYYAQEGEGAGSVATLKTANFLKSDPGASDKYDVTLEGSTASAPGSAVAAPLCSTL